MVTSLVKICPSHPTTTPFFVAYETPLTLKPPLITLIIFSVLDGTGGVSTLALFECLSLVAWPLFKTISLRCLYLRSLATSKQSAWHSFVLGP